MPRIAVYARSISGYADSFVLRQASSVGADSVLVAKPSQKVDAGTNCLAPAGARTRLLSRRIARVLTRAYVPVGQDVWACLRLAKEVRTADVVYTMFLDQAADLLIPLSQRKRPALVAAAVGSDITTVRSQPGWHVRSVTATIRRADIVLCNSRFIEGKVTELVPDRETVLHSPGIVVPPALQSRRESSSFKVLAVSRLVPVKGVDLSLDAFAAAFSRDRSARMLILGDGPCLGDLTEQARRLGIADRVTFAGRVSQDAVYEHMASADVLIQHNVRAPTGAEEGLGGSVLQAAAYALPVVASRSGGVTEAVVDGVSAVLVEPGDVDAMADALRYLRGNPARRVSMGRAGYDFVRSEHNAEIQDAKLATLLKSVADRC